MTIRDRESLLRRIRQVRRTTASREQSDSPPAAEPSPDHIQSLEARVAHLENLLEGLQDSVHRESERHSRLIADLQNQVDPGAMSAALAEDARQRGL